MKNCYNVVNAALGKFAPNAAQAETPFPTMHAVLVALGMDATEASKTIDDVLGVYQTGACPTCKTWRNLVISVNAALGGMLNLSLEFSPGIRKKSEFMFIEREDGTITLRLGGAVGHFTPDDQPSEQFVDQALNGINAMLDDQAFLRLWVEYTVVFAAVYKALGWETPLPPQLQEYVRDAQAKIAYRLAHA